MNPGLRKFLSLDYCSEETPSTVFVGNISRYEALALFNNFIACCNDEDRSLENIRNSALHSFCNSYDLNHQKALFAFFQEYVPHWQCAREFSRRNIETFIAKLSNSNFFFQRAFGPSITAPKFKIVTIHREPDKTAAVQKKRASCSIHNLKDACQKSSSPTPLCQGCITALNWAMKKGVITKDSTREDIVLYLENRQKEKLLRVKMGRKILPRHI